MQRPVLLSALVAAALVAGFAAPPSFGDQGRQVEQLQASAHNAAPASRMEGERAMRDAMAGAVIGAIARQFGETDVEVKLDALRSQQINLVDNVIAGEGRIRLGDSPTWVPVKFEGLYDTVSAAVFAPQLQLGDTRSATHGLPAKVALREQLHAQVTQRLRDEFAEQPVELVLEEATLQTLDARHSRLQAAGVTDFGVEGAVATTIDAVYDNQKGEWVRLDYALEGDAQQTQPEGAVAAL